MRCNVGIKPEYLTDQHLVAEYRELLIVYGKLKLNDFKIKTPIPTNFSLGTGHINFFKNKFVYLHKRWNLLVEELKKRGFQTNLNFSPYEHLPQELKQDWIPQESDFKLLQERIEQKILMKPLWYRYYSKNIDENFLNKFKKNDIYFV